MDFNLGMGFGTAAGKVSLAVAAKSRLDAYGAAYFLYDDLDPASGRLWQDSAQTTLCTASGDPVGAIQSSDPNGYLATQGTALDRPTLTFDATLGKWYLAFSGSQYMLTPTATTPGFGASASYTMGCAGRLTGDLAGMMGQASASGLRMRGKIGRAESTYPGEIQYWWQATSTIHGGSMSDSVDTAIILRGAGLAYDGYQNGSLVVTGTAVEASSFAYPIAIGGINVGGTIAQEMTGRIYEGIFGIKAALSDVHIAQVSSDMVV